MSERRDGVEREITLPLDPDQAWDMVTDRRHLERWLAPEVDLDPTEGGKVHVVDDLGEERRGVVELVERPHRLRWSWAPDGNEERTSVEITITPDHGRSLVRVVERRLLPIDAVAALTPRTLQAHDQPMLLAA